MLWIKEHGVRYFDPLTNMAQLSEEVGEVARIIALEDMVNNQKSIQIKKRNLLKNFLMLFLLLCV